jgi:hypothetical protein
MTGEPLTLTLPAPLAHELGSATQDFLIDLLARGLRDFRIERVLERYAHGDMSFGAAAQQVGVSQTELARLAYARGMEPPSRWRRWPRSWGERPDHRRLMYQTVDCAGHEAAQSPRSMPRWHNLRESILPDPAPVLPPRRAQLPVECLAEVRPIRRAERCRPG